IGTVPIGTGALRRIHSRVVWMLRPVERSITVSAPQRIAHTIFSTSSSTEKVSAESLAVGERIFRALEHALAPEVLALGDVDHLLGDYAGARPFELGQRLYAAAAQRRVPALE